MISHQSLLLSTTVLNDNVSELQISIYQISYNYRLSFMQIRISDICISAKSYIGATLQTSYIKAVHADQ